MNFEGKGLPYLNKKQTPVNFERKRFEFWLENVPSDIRRWEYDLWKCYKVLAQIDPIIMLSEPVKLMRVDSIEKISIGCFIRICPFLILSARTN